MKRLEAAILAGVIAVASCGGGDDDDDTAGADADVTAPDSGAGGTDASAALIPDPGTTMNGEWTDVEPNDRPDQATPVGIVTGPAWMGFVEPYTAINPEDDVDYFVMRTGDAASLDNVYLEACWSFTGNLADMYMYEVQGGVKGSMVASGTSGDASCEPLLAAGTGSSILSADTVYLVEVRGAPGLSLGGDPGLYSA